MFKNPDRRLVDMGFFKDKRGGNVPENKYGATYYRKDSYGFIQKLDIMHKKSGTCQIQSYQERTNSDGYHNCVGLTYDEAKVVLKKCRELKRKYKW